MVPAIIIIILIAALIWVLIYHHLTLKNRVELAASDKVSQLFYSAARFQTIFENAPVPYLILDTKGKILNLNKSALRFFNGTPEEIISTDFFSYIVEDKNGIGIAQFFATKYPIEKRQVRINTLKNDTRWVELSLLEIQENSRNYGGFVSIFDITDQKNLEQSKTEFISLTSHQLRTPLATNKWFTEMLLSPNFGELNIKQKEYVETIHEVTVNMVDVVDTLLNISRLELGKITVDMQPTNVPEICDSILVELAFQITKKNMRIQKQYEGQLTNLKNDPKLLRIIIHNLLTNAIKYTPDGGTITITAENKVGKDLITVTDTGYGIPAEQQNRIFTKMFRADNVKDISSSQSSGLGLYLIKSLVEAIGGTINFQSVENKGSSFIVSI